MHEFLEKKVQEATEKGYSETLFGRKRQVPELKQKERFAQQAGRRIALNTPIQGSAADIIKKAMIRLEEELSLEGIDARMIMQVHDELVIEAGEEIVEKAAKLAVEVMESAHALDVDLTVDVGWGANWSEAH